MHTVADGSIQQTDDVEEFWDELLGLVQDGTVVPIVGPELLTIDDGDGARVPLYRAVAEALLRKYPLGGGWAGAELRPNQELNDAVALLAGRGKPPRDLYRPIHDIIARLVESQAEAPPALRKLAAITHFRLFATTTPDSLLARALDAARHDGVLLTEEVPYAPKLPAERLRDLPSGELAEGYTGVAYLFGKADPMPFYAIHDEDALEFAYTLQQGQGPERAMAHLRRSNLLLVGCHLSEWLSRFFIRMSTSERLFADRSTREFVVGREAAHESGLTVFLRRFSRVSRCLGADAEEFVDELHRRWAARNPPRAAGPARDAPAAGAGAPAAGAIFISYASDDAAAARALHDEIRAIGGDVAWLDKTRLTPGVTWDREIRAAIDQCRLFVALVSRATEGRDEGYFRQEWADAAVRARRIQGRQFLLPVVVDPDYDGDASRYGLVPDAFRAVQFGHAPNGRPSGTLRAVLTEQLRALRRPGRGA